MLFSEKYADPDEKSYYTMYACQSATKGMFSKSGRKLRHIPNTYHRVPNIATFFVSAVNT